MQVLNQNAKIEFRNEKNPQAIADLKQLLMGTLWQRQWSDDIADQFFKWRYSDLGGSELLLAYVDGRLVAVVASSVRLYFIHGEAVGVREPADWFCHPDYRYLNFGARLMYMLMDRDEPLLSVGGTSDAKTVLPALGWQRLSDASVYTLALRPKFVLKKAARFLNLASVRFAKATGKLRSEVYPHIESQLARAQYQPSSHQQSAAGSAAAQTYELLPLIRDRELEWLYAAPKHFGAFFCLRIPEKTGTTALSLGRVFDHEGLRYAKLIHVQTLSPSAEAYAYVLSETLAYLREHKVDAAQVRASSPFLRKALIRSGFIRSALAAVHWWAKHQAHPAGRLHLTFLRGDDSIRPYPES